MLRYRACFRFGLVQADLATERSAELGTRSRGSGGATPRSRLAGRGHTLATAAALAAIVAAPSVATAAQLELDPSFNPTGTPGEVVAPSGSSVIDWAVAAQPNGKIVVAAAVPGEQAPGPPSFIRQTKVVRLNEDGSLDSGFNPAGPTPGEEMISYGTGTNSQPSAVVIDKQGRIVIIGRGDGPSGEYDWTVARLLNNGAPDPTFNPSGAMPGTEYAPRPTGTLFDAHTGTVAPDGKVLLAGGTASSLVERLNEDGSLDTSFNAEGAVPGTRALPGPPIASSVAVAINGNIAVATGNDGGSGQVNQLTSDGATVLWTKAAATYDASGGPRVYILPNGTVETTSQNFAARFLPDGEPDQSFGASGYVNLSLSNANSGYFPSALGPGNVTAVASADGNDLIDNSGSITTFAWSHTPYGTAIQPDGKILLVGSTSQGGVISRFLAPSSPPTAVTMAASEMTQTSGTLNAIVNPQGSLITSCRFEYGTSTSYGTSVPCSSSPGAGTSPVAVSATVTWLTANTEYHYRVTASNSGGTAYGIDVTFETAGPEFGRCLKIADAAGSYSNGVCTKLESTRTYEWYPAFGEQKPLERPGFTTGYKPTTTVKLETTGKRLITCDSENGTGEYDATTSVGSVRLGFAGCRNSMNEACGSGATPGRILTTPLTGTLGVITTSPEGPLKNRVGLLLKPTVGTRLAEFSCGVDRYVLTGAVIAKVKSNVMQLNTGVWKFTQAKGIQKPYRFEGGPEQTLELQLNENRPEQAGLALAAVVTNEEKVEINSTI
jgi:uncharacterized delta-60 repeat protein